MKKKVMVLLGFIGILVLVMAFLFVFKFKNFQIELGDTVTKESFIRFGNIKNTSVDLSKIDLNKVGEYHVEARYWVIKYNLKLKIVDTTPPSLEVKDIYRPLNYEIDAQDFIVDVSDKSEYVISYESSYLKDKYGEYPVKIIVKDKYANRIEKEAKLNISWVKNDYSIEVGNMIRREDLVHDQKDINTINQKELDVINANGEGIYKIVSKKDDMEKEITIEKTKDITPPELILKNVSIYNGKKVNDVHDFVSKVYDKVSKVTLNLLTEINYNKIGEQKIIIEACDEALNKVTKETTLKIMEDNNGPKISGLSKITVNKGTKINYQKGVSSYDDNFGSCTYSVDSSKVDTSKYGTYYAIYTSSDKLGNKTTAKRVVIVNHDKSDTDALVKKVASSLSSNAEKIRDYVRTIRYSTNNGGSDPTWYGLTNKSGNCIVHAYVFNALLKAKGYNTKIIWTTDKTHYWNMVYLNGKWVHMDSTPTSRHNKVSIMNDETRYANLQGRDWDRSLWPKAD